MTHQTFLSERRVRTEPFAWFNDLYTRDLIDLDPPYQRRSVWNDSFRRYFIDTVLLNYPCPPIFLYEEISSTGVTRYRVVDGKQRLTTLFKFVRDEFPVSERSPVARLQGLLFSDFADDDKRLVWRYQLSVEMVPQENEVIINEIFDRINRNVAKLTAQELRHDKYNGEFITQIEDLTMWMESVLTDEFRNFLPNLADK